MKTSNAPRIPTRTIQQIQQAISVALLLAAGVLSVALLIQRWELIADGTPSPEATGGDRRIDFRGRDADAWAEYWLIVGQAAGTG